MTSRFEITHKDGTPLEWGVNRFPDGQIQFWATATRCDIRECQMKCAITDSEGLDLFFQVTHTLPLANMRVNYLYGARSDKSVAGDRIVCNVPLMIFQAVGCGLVNSMNWVPRECKIELLTPHCLTAVHDFFQNPRNPTVVNEFPDELLPENYDLIVFPDKTASTRFAGFGDLDWEVIHKQRDQVTGEVETQGKAKCVDSRRILVMDDLCDGGRTFLGLAEQIRRDNEIERLDLYVAHGVFSNGALGKLLNVYDRVYTTNSLPVHACDGKVVVKDVWQ